MAIIHKPCITSPLEGTLDKRSTKKEERSPITPRCTLRSSVVDFGGKRTNE